ncbi:hypothetical protein DWB85_10565 [Seongchinamella sediminis]|uniref:Peptidase inhibitor I9 n=1 Tax=Seongchinamella sediminis TaxID=2283635 RepID=A0A3L7DYI8_9GAMM|nr:S8 family serine peptidase [Seongchinamella sediminis]RLQ21725.1 hypothetical protein DWB85_10565 [Seongchinamella sediminis]
MAKFSGIAVTSLAAVLLSSPSIAVDIGTPDKERLLTSLSQVKESKTGVYIVQMSDNPVAAYDGGIKGLKATRPGKNKKLNPRDKNVADYANYLVDRHDAALRAVGAGQKVHSYKYVYNGFSAKLSRKQANALKKMPGVLAVTPDRLLKPDTITTSHMLELDSGIWNDVGGIDSAGEDIIVGIIDSGIWPESSSFADTVDLSEAPGKSGKNKLAYSPPPANWSGSCRSGQNWSQNTCNNKLIGAQWFVEGFTANGKSHLLKYEFLSARDFDGHGTHTASTAAGNANVPVVINGQHVGEASGMAPRARVAAYKVCWGTGTDGGCFSSDSVKAIDQAVADGVDVLNFSISGSRTTSLDPVEVAFLFAADAGVFVAASAGNSGPGPETVAHNSPWLTTVAAGTHDRGYTASVTTGEDITYEGVSLGSGVSGDLVYAGDAGDILCNPGSLDSAVVTGKVVLCDRGDIARVDKSRAVKEAGGIGMILANQGPNSLNADFHTVPSIHVDHIAGDALRTYAQSSGASADISEGTQYIAEASQVAAFSSRGPALAHGGDLLKPDIMAPGVDIIAAVSPAGSNGQSFDALSGTSMSSPHMAGLGALMKQAHPDWSPAMIKSAFMTTATTDTNEGNPIDGGALDYGAGFVQPNAATNPGLAYDSGWVDWLGFLCGSGELQAAYCPQISIDPSDLNYPSIAIGALAGSQTVQRTVTNVGPAGEYEVSVTAPAGIAVDVFPSELELAQGESASYEVTFTNEGAELQTWLEGDITWSGDAHTVRSPFVLNAVELAAPAEVTGTQTDGELSFPVTFGYDGEYSINVHGLAAADMQEGTVVDDPANDINTALGTGVGISVHFVERAEGAVHQRISLFDDYTDGVDDLDLYVFDADSNFVAGSGSGTSAEQVDIPNPASDGYYVIVHGWQTDGPDAAYTLFSWSVAGDETNMTASDPGDAALGASADISVEWMDLLEDTKYLGKLSHQNGVDEIGQTMVVIETD